MTQSYGSEIDQLLSQIISAAEHEDNAAVASWMKELHHLDEEVKSFILKTLADFRLGGTSTSMDALWQVDFDRRPVTITEFLENPFYLGNSANEIYPVWVEELKYVLDPNSKIVEWIFCLQGGTPIPLLDGRTLPIKELAGSDPVHLYSLDEQRNITVGRAWNIRKTGRDQIVRINLDDGTYVEANPRHELVLLNGRKKRILDLKPGDRLSPFYRRKSESKRTPGYEEVYNSGSGDWLHTHYMSARWKYGDFRLSGGRNVYHHKDFNKYNNDPSNLEQCRFDWHRKYHASRRKEYLRRNPEVLKKLVDKQRGYFKDPESSVRQARVLGMHRRSCINHTIVSIEYTDRHEDVYCMTVDRYHNFAILGRDQETDLPVEDSGIISGNTGAIGLGKTFISLIAQLYKLYWISCLRSPQSYFGLASDSEIVFGMYNVTLSNASIVDYGQMMKFIDGSPYFRDVFPRKNITSQIYFPQKEIFFNLGSSELHALGQNLFAYIMDEVNFMRTTHGEDEQGQAWEIYHHTRRRQRSRFEQYGQIPGLCCIVSSRKSHSSFLEVLMEEVKDDPKVHISDYALWDVKGRDKYSPKVFRVALGDRYRSSEILDKVNVDSEEIIESTESDPGQEIIEVPMNFYVDFRRDVEGCFTGDTKISLLDGTEVPIKDLVGRDEFYVYSFDPETHRMHPGRGHSARLTEENAQLVVVILDNGERIRCTPDHKFMRRDGSWCEAKDLKAEDSLMSLYRKVDRHPTNHKVVSVEWLADREDVYDITVDRYHNFSLSSGVVVHNSLRDIAGIPTFAIQPLIRRVESVYECIDKERKHPMLSESYELAISDPTADLLQQMDWGLITKIQHGTRVMKMHPAEARYIHVDLAISGDCAGIAMAHAYDYYPITRHDPYTGQVVEEYKPKVWVDLMLQIRPTSGSQIDISKIVAFVLNLRNWGVPLERTTFDGFQSAMAIQLIEKAGQIPKKYKSKTQDGRMSFSSGLLSVDRSDLQYTILRDLISYNAISYYEYGPFLEEIVNLQHDVEKGKVDHQDTGSKDVADALAGAVYNVITHSQGITMEPGETFRSPPAVEDLGQDLGRALIADYPESIKGIEPKPVADRVVKARPLSGNRTDVEAELMKQLGIRKRND